MITAIKVYACFALVSSAFIVWAGTRWQSRKAVILDELEEPIRAASSEIILP